MTAEQNDKELNIQSEITNMVIDAVGGIENINKTIRTPDDSIWIYLEDGSIKVLMVHDCEPEGANLD